MSNGGDNPFAKGQLRREAADWFLKMREPDAEKHRANFEKWLARGAMHRAAYNSIANTYMVAKGVDWDRVPPPRRVRGTVIRTRFALAASIMLVAFVIWRLMFSPPGFVQRAAPSLVASSSEPSGRLATRLGEIRRVTLSDGSSLILDTDTLVFVAYRNDERELRLEHGRARFEVAHDGRPFIVDAGRNQVIARGTVFDVNVMDSGDVSVHLLDGKVEVRGPRAGPRSGHLALAVLRPGDEVRLANSDGRVTRLAPDDEDTSHWPEGTVDFDHVPLGEVIEAANRYSLMKIRLGASDLKQIPVSGVFRINDPERLANSLALLFKLRVSRTKREIVLERL